MDEIYLWERRRRKKKQSIHTVSDISRPMHLFVVGLFLVLGFPRVLLPLATFLLTNAFALVCLLCFVMRLLERE